MRHCSIAQRSRQLGKPFQRRFQRSLLLLSDARGGARKNRTSRLSLADQPARLWRAVLRARCSSARQRKRPKKDRDAHGALPRWTPRFSPRDRKRRGSHARNSAISSILSPSLCLPSHCSPPPRSLSLALPLFLPPSLTLSLSLSLSLPLSLP